ncbi:hypothetical protein BKA82DRAFT_323095 [Pisolithus tinctorius]|uniref:Uncharacterized protein n=1 Tax=Pisolithus tinctorius Marx 270 TaxID=870435 RepID=A0A0C3PJC4_PISTI|nr:hypothetical protein BKA82DRAFT_323095 [Pisolithus tinctorius]KIO08696.1 hypothetical protein M404DRAFT_323095 [Pisolithus tinctorius Marx 270]
MDQTSRLLVTLLMYGSCPSSPFCECRAVDKLTPTHSVSGGSEVYASPFGGPSPLEEAKLHWPHRLSPLSKPLPIS